MVRSTAVIVVGLAINVAARADNRADPMTSDALIDIAAGFSVHSPAASSNEYEPYPAFDAVWQQDAAKALEANADGFKAARALCVTDSLQWPAAFEDSESLKALSAVRRISNQLTDAAILHNIQGHDRAFAEKMLDTLHLMSLLLGDPVNEPSLVRYLTECGISMLACRAIHHAVPSLSIGDGATDTTPDQVRAIIAALSSRSANAERFAAMKIDEPDTVRLVSTRSNAQRNLAATALAIALYRHDHDGAFPASLDELVPDYLPAVPTDPTGPAGSLIGYVTIRGALPDGSDRPMLYFRSSTTGPLEYVKTSPQFEFYNVSLPQDPFWSEARGQFRDLKLWEPQSTSRRPEDFAPLSQPH